MLSDLKKRGSEGKGLRGFRGMVRNEKSMESHASYGKDTWRMPESSSDGRIFGKGPSDDVQQSSFCVRSGRKGNYE